MSLNSHTTLDGYRLEIERPSASPIQHPLEDGRSVFIGKGDSCGIQVTGDGVADIHCLIELDGETVAIQDWASDSGTKINGKLIEDKTELASGDSIVVGGVQLTLRGKPSVLDNGGIDSANKAAEEPEEESVGMEHLLADSAVNDEELAKQLSAALRPAGERLSDQLDPHGETDVPPAEEDSSDQDLGLNADPDPVDEFVSDMLGDFDDQLDDPLEDELESRLDGDFDESSDSGSKANGFGFDSPSPSRAADLAGWDPSELDDEPVDAEIVQLLKDEIEDLRIQLAERDEQLATMDGFGEFDEATDPSSRSDRDDEFGGVNLVERVDDLVAELAEHDERVATLQELLQTAEVQNQAEREERYSLESWVTEIEQRMSERESEWHAERDGLREQLTSVAQQRDQFQQRLHTVAQRYGNSAVTDVVPDEMLQKLQARNAELEAQLEQEKKRSASLKSHVDRMKTDEPESVESLRAELAKEKADVSRLRFQLSKQLQDIGATPSPKNQADKEFSHKLQTLREHLREIHEEEKLEREQRGDSLFGRISNLWKRVDDEY